MKWKLHRGWIAILFIDGNIWIADVIYEEGFSSRVIGASSTITPKIGECERRLGGIERLGAVVTLPKERSNFPLSQLPSVGYVGIVVLVSILIIVSSLRTAISRDLAMRKIPFKSWLRCARERQAPCMPRISRTLGLCRRLVECR